LWISSEKIDNVNETGVDDAQLRWEPTTVSSIPKIIGHIQSFDIGSQQWSHALLYQVPELNGPTRPSAGINLVNGSSGLTSRSAISPTSSMSVNKECS